MDILFTIFSFILLISIIVGIHELGHFLAARFYKIHVLKFKIGFGKELFSFQDKNACHYSFGLLPLGGYVQMLGENNPIQEGEDINFSAAKSYQQATAGERAVVTFAGPFANFLLAALVYCFLALVGTTQLSSYVGYITPDSLSDQYGITSKDKIIEIDQESIEGFNDINLALSKRIGDSGVINMTFSRDDIIESASIPIKNWLSGNDQITPSLALGIHPLLPPVIGKLQENGPATKFGLKEGDLITSVDKKEVVSWQELSNILGTLPDQLIEIDILRNQTSRTILLETTSFIDEEGNKRGRIGILASNNFNEWPSDYVFVNKESFLLAPIYGVKETYRYTVLILSSIGKLISGSISADNLGGPIQISVLAGSAAKAGYITFLSMIALLSINLGLLNLLPIPILDGGQLLMIAIEKIKGSPVSDMALEYTMRLGLVFVVSLMIFAFANDIARLI